MRKMLPAAGLALTATLLYAAKLMPPPTKSEPVTDDIHGVKITDPYRWLEDQNSPADPRLAGGAGEIRAHLSGRSAGPRAAEERIRSAVENRQHERARGSQRPILLQPPPGERGPRVPVRAPGLHRQGRSAGGPQDRRHRPHLFDTLPGHFARRQPDRLRHPQGRRG